MLIRTEQFYTRYLQEYYDQHYGQFEETTEWYNNPEINVWIFKVPELGLLITLTCLNDGEVLEQRETIDIDSREKLPPL